MISKIYNLYLWHSPLTQLSLRSPNWILYILFIFGEHIRTHQICPCAFGKSYLHFTLHRTAAAVASEQRLVLCHGIDIAHKLHNRIWMCCTQCQYIIIDKLTENNGFDSRTPWSCSRQWLCPVWNSEEKSKIEKKNVVERRWRNAIIIIGQCTNWIRNKTNCSRLTNYISRFANCASCKWHRPKSTLIEWSRHHKHVIQALRCCT